MATLGVVVPVAEAGKDARTANTISFWDEQRGIAGAGRPYRKDSHGGILLTTDGGRTFRIVLRTKRVVNWVDTAGTADAWATAGDGETTRLWHSGDGGLSWHRLPRARTWGPSFSSAAVGLGVAGDSAYYSSTHMRTELVASSDGGASWQARSHPCPDFLYFMVSQPSADAAWALCTNEGAVGTQEKAVYGSTDGGLSWRQLARTDWEHPPIGGISGLGYPLGISMSVDGFGFMWGHDLSYLTRNGGRNWKPLSRRKKLVGVRSASVLSSQIAYALEAEGWGDLSVTHDGGRHWTAIHRFPPLQ